MHHTACGYRLGAETVPLRVRVNEAMLVHRPWLGKVTSRKAIAQVAAVGSANKGMILRRQSVNRPKEEKHDPCATIA